MRPDGFAAWGLALGVLAAAPRGFGQARPRWAELGGIRIRGSVDDILALNGDCHPMFDPAVQVRSAWAADAVAQFAFGFALPHHHADSAAVRTALAGATVCRVAILDGRSVAMVVAINRTVVGATAIFVPPDSGVAVNVDSVRALVWGAWGRPSAPSVNLDSWLAPQYRGYLLVRRASPSSGASAAAVQVIMVDVVACTAFERRVHQAAHHGAAERC